MSCTVAIIGAGPAGLASAKAALEAGLSARVFESAEAIGGLWSPASKLCRPSMRTNLSKYTCCFSDFPWPESAPTFPTASQVGDYLSAYAHKYLKPATISLGCKVTGVKSPGDDKRWSVTWSNRSGQQETAIFDRLIIACGFFSEPYIPAIPGLETFPGTVSHSSFYSSHKPFEGKHVAIIGGSHSGVEVADDITPHAASVHHVVPRQFWVVPKHLPLDVEDPGTSFLPLDLVLYRYPTPVQTHSSTQERWREMNEYLRSFSGNLSDFSADMKADMNSPPHVAVSDMYTNFVRSGRIILHKGRLSTIFGSNLNVDPEKSLPLSNMTDIIFATGFRPSSASTILPPSLLSALNFSPNDRFLPFLLHHGTLHPSFPNAAFVGQYRGPYWASIELQAQWCAGLFSGSLSWPSPNQFEEGLALEKQVIDSRPRAQWPREYVKFCSDLAQTIGTPLSPSCPGPNKRLIQPHDIFAPHRLTRPFWLPSSNHQCVTEETPSLLDTLEHTLSQSANSALFVAAAIFRSLHGTWVLNRTYTSHLPDYPSGPSIGTAEFTPRKILSESHLESDHQIYETEYFYSEKTEFSTSTGLKLSGTQRYIYRYDESKDKLEVFFAQRDDAVSRGSRFHQVIIEPPSLDAPPIQASQSTMLPWRAKASHYCSPDTYDGSYTFFFKGADLEKWKIEYVVKGPKKDYTMESWYSRM